MFHSFPFDSPSNWSKIPKPLTLKPKSCSSLNFRFHSTIYPFIVRLYIYMYQHYCSFCRVRPWKGLYRPSCRLKICRLGVPNCHSMDVSDSPYQAYQPSTVDMGNRNHSLHYIRNSFNVAHMGSTVKVLP